MNNTFWKENTFPGTLLRGSGGAGSNYRRYDEMWKERRKTIGLKSEG